MKLPKLNIHSYLEIDTSTRICTLEESRELLEFGSRYIVMAEQQIIQSYDELVELLSRDENKNKSSIDVSLVSFAEGG